MSCIFISHSSADNVVSRMALCAYGACEVGQRRMARLFERSTFCVSFGHRGKSPQRLQAKISLASLCFDFSTRSAALIQIILPSRGTVLSHR